MPTEILISSDDPPHLVDFVSASPSSSVPANRSICVISSSPVPQSPKESKQSLSKSLGDSPSYGDIHIISSSPIATNNSEKSKDKSKIKARSSVSLTPELYSVSNIPERVEDDMVLIDNVAHFRVIGRTASPSEFEDIRLMAREALRQSGFNSSNPTNSSQKDVSMEFSATTAAVLADLSKGNLKNDWNDTLFLEENANRSNAVDVARTAVKPIRQAKNTSDKHEASDENVQPLANLKRKRVNIYEKERAPKHRDCEKKKKREKEAEKERKRAEVEVEKERKRREKEMKALQKHQEQELVSVNKLRQSRKESMPEMIVDVSRDWSEAPAGQQLIRFLEPQGCEIYENWESPVPHVVKWRRKIKAEWNEKLGYFIPIPEVIRSEKHILVVVKAEEFVEFAAHQVKLDQHVNNLRTVLANGCSDVKPIYVIEGLAALIRKSRNAKSRNFQGAVRKAIERGDASAIGNARGTGRAPSKSIEEIDENVIEDALLNLQIAHGCLIHHTLNTTATSEWIRIFTTDISTIPYKLSRMNFSTSFCTDVGQVRTGADRQDIYLKMLQEINRVTVGVAAGIINKYPTVKSLIEGFRKRGEGALADLDILAGSNPTGRKIGHALSRRIYKIFMGEDPDCIDL